MIELMPLLFSRKPNFDVKRMIRPLRVCMHCGELMVHSKTVKSYPLQKNLNMVCGACGVRLIQHFLSGQVIDYKWPVYSVLRWAGPNAALVGQMIKSLKGGGASDVFASAAEELCHIRMQSKNKLDLNGALVVPAPPRTEGKKDHAYELAEKIAQNLKVNMSCALSRASNEEQKRKNVTERKMLVEAGRFFLNKSIKRKYNSVLFIDDVITTGATAEAAYRALGHPKKFEVWTMAYRPRLSVSNL